MEVGFHTVDGVRVRCAESTRLSAPSILLTSPWPESVYAFARVWPSLAAVARLVALDLPGFGRSERRDAGHFVWEERPDEYASPYRRLGHGRVPRGGGTWAVMSPATDGGSDEREQ